MVVFTGLSGSGKSSLAFDTIFAEGQRRYVESLSAYARQFLGQVDRPDVDFIEGLSPAVAIEQKSVGRSPRSNPATYTDVWTHVRDLYAMLPESRLREYKKGRFSFNVAGGRCGACEGHGSTRLDMDFLADVWVACEVCGGSRFAKDTLEVRWKGKNVADILGMEIGEALELFADAPDIARKLQTLCDVGLDYLHLGQPSPTLSGGEAQRVKLSRELAKRSTGSTLYILDEPTTGLHMHDVRQLIEVLERLVDAGNTVLVVEHNLDVVKRADHVIDLGPEGGGGGGQIVAAGTPEQIAKSKISETGKALKPVLAAANELAASGKPRRRAVKKSAAVTPAAVARAVKKSLAAIEKQSRDPGPPVIMVRGAAQHNLKKVDADLPRGAVTVCCGPSGSGKTTLLNLLAGILQPDGHILDVRRYVGGFRIVDGGSEFARHEGSDYGVVFADCNWNLEREPA